MFVTLKTASGTNYRFTVGTKVLCRTGSGNQRCAQEWSAGVIVALTYWEPKFPQDKTVPYFKVKLDEGPLILVPVDNDQLCKKLVPPVSIPSVTDFGTRLAAVVLFQQQHHRLPKQRRARESNTESSLARWLQNAKRRMIEQKLTPELATQLLAITQISADARSQHPVPIQCQLLFEGTVPATTRLLCIN